MSARAATRQSRPVRLALVGSAPPRPPCRESSEVWQTIISAQATSCILRQGMQRVTPPPALISLGFDGAAHELKMKLAWAFGIIRALLHNYVG